jgi:hypothetical protein
MTNGYNTLHNYIREDLLAANQSVDEQTLNTFEDFAHLTEGPADPQDVRTTKGKLNSDGSAGPVTNTSPYNVLKLNFAEMAALMAGTIKDVGILIIDGGNFNVTKAGIALAGLINRFQNAATRKLNSSDGKVIFAIARVDKTQSKKSDIKAAYQELFSEELTENQLEESLKVLAGYKILIETGASIRLKERLNIVL